MTGKIFIRTGLNGHAIEQCLMSKRDLSSESFIDEVILNMIGFRLSGLMAYHSKFCLYINDW